MNKTRNLQQISHDMNQLLFKYSGNYQGSPYKGEADFPLKPQCL
jgi:hypothetical protein